MPDALSVVRTADALRGQVRHWRKDGLSVGLVPTMGALHEGHLTLVRHALSTCDRVIVTLFVNPTQFGPHEDFAAYPRDEARDRALVEGVGAHVLFAPDVLEMYPSGDVTEVMVPGLGDVLDGRFRPGHFTGVATVVSKLLNVAAADHAFFGEKDFQQLQIIKRLAADLLIPTKIHGVPTVREDDGLALSSRNVYLTGAERQIAPKLYATLVETAKAFKAGGDGDALEVRAAETLLQAGFAKIDYVAIVDVETLTEMPSYDASRPARILAAAQLGRARLIDNVPVDES